MSKPNIFPCTIETRLTYDHGEKKGMTANYPLGLFNYVDRQGRRVEIERGQWPITLELEWRPGWALIAEVSGQVMWKIRTPESSEPDYREYRFHFYGKLYILDFRFDSIPGSVKVPEYLCPDYVHRISGLNSRGTCDQCDMQKGNN